MYAIELAHINKSFKARNRKTRVLYDVMLQVHEGEAFGFIGPNGAGKSTTIKIMMDILRPDSGVARFFGESCRRPEAREGVAYLPENPYLYDYLTPLELVQMGVKQHKVRCRDVKQHSMAWLERFDMAPAAHRRIRNLSKRHDPESGPCPCPGLQSKAVNFR